MKILFIHDYNPFILNGGIETNTRFVGTTLTLLGHEVAIAYPKKFGEGHLPNIQLITVGNTASLKQISEQFDAVVAIGTMSARPLFTKSLEDLPKTSVPFIAYFRATSQHRPFSSALNDTPRSEIDATDRNLNRLLANPRISIIANSQAMKKDIHNIFPKAKSNEIKVVYPGPSWHGSGSYKSERRNNSKKFIFLNISGTTNPDKGGIVLWQAFSDLQNHLKQSGVRTQIHLWMVGEGELLKHFKSLQLCLKINNVKFFGELPHHEILKLISKSNALVHPSLTESFGNVLIESMGMGKPVITSNFEGMREIVKLTKGGLLFRRGSSTDLAKKMTDILNPQVYNRLTTNIKKARIQEKFNVEKQALELLRILKPAHHSSTTVTGTYPVSTPQETNMALLEVSS